MAYTPDLFSPAVSRSLLDNLQTSFASWRAEAVSTDRLQRKSTLQVYEDMWGAFAAWCVSQDAPVSLESLDGPALERFLGSREEKLGDTLSPRYTWRLLTLIDRVLTRNALECDAPKNDSAAEYIRCSDSIRRANISERPALDFLHAAEARRLVTFLSEARPDAVGRRQLSGWQELRNMTAVALHLGAGVTPGDLRELPLEAPVVSGGRWKDVPWKLRVPGNGNRPGRETPVAPWAGQLLKHWLVARADLRPSVQALVDAKGGKRVQYLLPNRSGDQWGKMAHYEAIKKVMKAADVDPGASSGGAFRLRHTFAIRQLRRKKAVADVARWMGIANLEEMNRYRSVLDNYEEAA